MGGILAVYHHAVSLAGHLEREHTVFERIGYDIGKRKPEGLVTDELAQLGAAIIPKFEMRFYGHSSANLQKNVEIAKPPPKLKNGLSPQCSEIQQVKDEAKPVLNHCFSFNI